MFDMKDILDRMVAGENAEDIAKEMTKALNDAIAEKEAMDKKNAEAEENAKRAAIRKVFEGVKEFCEAIGHSDLFTQDELDEFANSDGVIDEFTDLVEELVPLLDFMRTLSKLCDDETDCGCANPKKHIYNNPIAKAVRGKPGSATAKVDMSDKDIVSEFLKMFS